MSEASQWRPALLNGCRGFIKLILEESEYGQIAMPEGIYDTLSTCLSDEHVDNTLNDLLKNLRVWCNVWREQQERGAEATCCCQ